MSDLLKVKVGGKNYLCKTLLDYYPQQWTDEFPTQNSIGEVPVDFQGAGSELVSVSNAPGTYGGMDAHSAGSEFLSVGPAPGTYAGNDAQGAGSELVDITILS
jgi:hypothetical protein